MGKDGPIFEYKGEIHYITQTKNYISFSTKVSANEYYIYLFDKKGNKKFEQKLTHSGRATICENQKKLLISSYDNSEHGESYINKLYDFENGKEFDVSNLYTVLKLTKGGKYLYGSVHLFDNGGPLDIYNIETEEQFTIKLRNWSKVTSLVDNKLIIMEQLSERNKEKLKYQKDKKQRSIAYLNERLLYKSSYKKGEINKEEYQVTNDSLKEKYGLKNAKEPRLGTWTQLGTRMKIFDLERKAFVFETELKDENNNIIVLNRDDYNSYSLTVDEENNIYIVGLRKNNNTVKRWERMFLKYDKNYILIWAKNVENFSTPERIEYLERVKFVFTKENKILNKKTGKLETYKKTNPKSKKVIFTSDMFKLDSIQVGPFEFDFKKKMIWTITEN